MYGFSTEEWSKLNPDQKFYWFFHDWAKRQGKIFIEEYCDGYQPEGLIDGMEVDDVWGWLVDSEDEVDDEYFGC